MKLDDLATTGGGRGQGGEPPGPLHRPGAREPPALGPAAVALGAAAVVLAVGLPLLFAHRTRERITDDGAVDDRGTHDDHHDHHHRRPPLRRLRPPRRRRRRRRRRWRSWWPRRTRRSTPRTVTRCGRCSTTTAVHPVYFVEGRTGTIADNIAPALRPCLRLRCRGSRCWGSSSCSGDVVVVPVAYTYPEPIGVLTGFDVLVVRHVDGGLLVGGAATFFADDRPDLVADPAEAQALIEASSAAFNADDVEGVLATMTGDALLWEDMTDAETVPTGAPPPCGSSSPTSLLHRRVHRGAGDLRAVRRGAEPQHRRGHRRRLRRHVPLLDPRRRDRPPGLRAGRLTGDRLAPGGDLRKAGKPLAPFAWSEWRDRRTGSAAAGGPGDRGGMP